MNELTQLAGGSQDELRVAFRRLLAHVASIAARRPLPLEGQDPRELQAFVSAALAAGLFEDLGWLSAASAASALYELAAALPPSRERDALSRMVTERLIRADAATFVALATALAQGGSGGLSSLAMRARVSLSLSLPLSSGGRVDVLALALISHPDYVRDWVEEPSKGSLPSRRLSARLIERAAREAARRFEQGDDAGLRAFEGLPLKAAWARLLTDRESLVWRHVAVARGLLCGAVPELEQEVGQALAPELSSTEWRRAATSLAASIAVLPAAAAARCQGVLQGELLVRDPGLAACMMMGVLRAAEAQPQAVQPLLGPLVKAGGLQAAEVLLDLLDEGLDRELLSAAREALQQALSDVIQANRAQPDDGELGVVEWVLGRINHGAGQEASLQATLRAALAAFVEQGAEGATVASQAALASAKHAVQQLTAWEDDSSGGRRQMVRTLIQLELGLLQASTLSDLVALRDHDAARGALHELFEQLTEWLLRYEHRAVPDQALSHPTLRMRRVRALLHVIDADGGYGDSWAEARRARRLRTTRVLLNRLRREPPSTLTRVLLASLSRSFDALVREQVFEISDVVLCAALYVRSPRAIATLAEASMMPELTASLSELASLVRTSEQDGALPSAGRHGVDALRALVAALPAARSTRASVLRWALQRVQLALRPWIDARSLAEVAGGRGAAAGLADLGDALLALAQLVAGTRRRLNPEAQVRLPSVAARVHGLAAVLEEALETQRIEPVRASLQALDASLESDLAGPFHALVMRVLSPLAELPILAPVNAQSASGRASPEVGASRPKLPAWLPASRRLGGFEVMHPIGEGGGGSVFVVRRAEETGDDAELFALKVPEYNGDVAHLLSEAEFLKLFREEAGALLSLPEGQPNLARFVTFDAGIKPKPILVMEYVEGPSLEKLMLRRYLDVSQAFTVLEGIARGLCAMHEVGIAHLDLKPANVIVRGFWEGQVTPVIVDFGLSGRRLRPGCGTATYAAPEIWGTSEVSGSDPRPADVYAFGCVAYELLSGQTLFSANTELAIVAAHVNHDGIPAGLLTMGQDPGLRPLVEWLAMCLRQQPAARATLPQVAQAIPQLRAALEERSWPLMEK